MNTTQDPDYTKGLNYFNNGRYVQAIIVLEHLYNKLINEQEVVDDDNRDAIIEIVTKVAISYEKIGKYNQAFDIYKKFNLDDDVKKLVGNIIKNVGYLFDPVICPELKKELVSAFMANFVF